MKQKIIKSQLQLRSATTGEWLSSTSVLAPGEPALEIYTDDNDKTQYLMKIGNGIDSFQNLPYFHQFSFQVLDHEPDETETNPHTITFVIDQ